MTSNYQIDNIISDLDPSLDDVQLGGARQEGSDPFTDMRQGKKDRMKLNDKQHMGNLKAAMKASGPGALPATLKLAASLPEHGKGKPTKRKDLEADVRIPFGDVAIVAYERVLLEEYHPDHVLNLSPH